MSDRYERLVEQVLDDPGAVLLLGSMDSGRTTFARALLAGAVDRGIPAAYLDTDVGRTTVGPPTTIGLKHVLEAKHLSDDELARADGLYFVGWVSAQFHLLPLIAGTAKLMDVARRAGAELIVVDTSSLISGVYGQILKYHKMEVTRRASPPTSPARCTVGGSNRPCSCRPCRQTPTLPRSPGCWWAWRTARGHASASATSSWRRTAACG
jgi:polynucleotide 5'-kinase involved in rRNA processing